MIDFESNIEENKSGIKLNLTWRGITDNDIPSILEFIMSNDEITKFDLSYNSLANIGAKALLESPVMKNIQGLNLSHNRITGSGIDYLSNLQNLQKIYT